MARWGEKINRYYQKLLRSRWPGAVGIILLGLAVMGNLLLESRFSFAAMHVLAIILATYAWRLRGMIPFIAVCLTSTVAHEYANEGGLATSSLLWNGINALSLYLIVGGATLIMHDNQRTIERLAGTDWLTGLSNRRLFDARLAQEIARSHRFQQALSLLMLDVDNLKQVNDRHGHLAGDALLQTAAQTIRARLRTTDLAGRYGGDEFVILLPNTSDEGSRKLADELRASVAAALSSYTDAQGRPLAGVSIGMASWQPDLITSRDLIQQADRALYAAKRAGKNRVYSTVEPLVSIIPTTGEYPAAYH